MFIRRWFARRAFESSISKIMNSALGHEAERLPAGAPEYVRLWDTADKALTSYCKTWNVERLDLEAQIPAVRKLRSLAQPGGTSNSRMTPGTVIGSAIALAVALFLVGAFSGLVQAGHAYVLKFLHLM